jgi:hypothetical protein
MLIPSNYNLIPPFFNDLPDLAQFWRIHSTRFHKDDWVQPKLGILLRRFDVNMRRLGSFEAKEKEAVAAFTENFGHDR